MGWARLVVVSRMPRPTPKHKHTPKVSLSLSLSLSLSVALSVAGGEPKLSLTLSPAKPLAGPNPDPVTAKAGTEARLQVLLPTYYSLLTTCYLLLTAYYLHLPRRDLKCWRSASYHGTGAGVGVRG